MLYIALSVMVVAVFLAVTVLSSFKPPQVPNTSSVSSHASSFQVLKTNVTIPYRAGCMVLEQIGHTCPTMTANPETSNSSLRGIELIAYQGTDYYAGTFSKGPYAGGNAAFPSVWFTNSTIFCISPHYANYPTCPVNEPLPPISW